MHLASYAYYMYLLVGTLVRLWRGPAGPAGQNARAPETRPPAKPETSQPQRHSTDEQQLHVHTQHTAIRALSFESIGERWPANTFLVPKSSGPHTKYVSELQNSATRYRPDPCENSRQLSDVYDVYIRHVKRGADGEKIKRDKKTGKISNRPKCSIRNSSFKRSP
jgi:hypothetical protein